LEPIEDIWRRTTSLDPYNAEEVAATTAASAGILNLRTALKVLSDRLEFAAYCRNATDNRGKVVVEQLPEPIGIISHGTPRSPYVRHQCHVFFWQALSFMAVELDSQWQSAYVLEPSSLSEPMGSVFAPDGQLYVAQFLSSQISEIDVETESDESCLPGARVSLRPMT